MWTNLFNGVYRCPTDKKVSPLMSYGLNVFFELGPYDSYVGSPQTWRRLAQIPKPATTVLAAEVGTAADHIMPHFWISLQDARGEVAWRRHREKSIYSFVDGHAQLLPLTQTYSPPALDWWNPLQ